MMSIVYCRTIHSNIHHHIKKGNLCQHDKWWYNKYGGLPPKQALVSPWGCFFKNRGPVDSRQISQKRKTTQPNVDLAKNSKQTLQPKWTISWTRTISLLYTTSIYCCKSKCNWAKASAQGHSTCFRLSNCVLKIADGFPWCEQHVQQSQHHAHASYRFLTFTSADVNNYITFNSFAPSL